MVTGHRTAVNLSALARGGETPQQQRVDQEKRGILKGATSKPLLKLKQSRIKNTLDLEQVRMGNAGLLEAKRLIDDFHM